MSNTHAASNPQLVTAKAMAKLSVADREAVVLCQQGYIPLSGELVKKLSEETGEKELTNER